MPTPFAQPIPILRLLAGCGLLLLAGCHTVGGDRAGVDSGGWQFRELAAALPTMPSASRHTKKAWREWGEDNLLSGDVIFVRGECRILLGLVDFSKLCSEVTHSPFSHVGIVAREGSSVVVYDTISSGPRRVPFDEFVTDELVWAIAIKRPENRYRWHVEPALAFCRDVYKARIKFDNDFRPDDDRLYCSEMIEMAYRRSGLELCPAVPIDQLPGFGELSPGALQFIRTTTSIDTTQGIYVPGNDSIGLWSSPRLKLVLPETDKASPPGT